MFTAQIQGRLGQDPEMRYTTSGTAICQVSVAHSQGWGDRKETIWVTVNVWGKRGEKLNEYGKKGQYMCFAGDIEQQSWEKDGEKKTKWVLKANDWGFGPKTDGDDAGNAREETSSRSPSRRSADRAEELADEDVPF